jgi:CubicO group peptidase (beta-lactamase class C family)
LETKGKLRTSDLLSKYLGVFPKEKSSATIHHLLTHTAGLIPDGAQLDYSSRKAFIQSVKDAPMETLPGEKYRYSNAGYSLLAAIVEEVSGLPFEVYLQKNIFDTAGLTSTGFAWDSRFKDSPVAIGYKGKKVEELSPVPPQADIWGARGPGNLITTVEELYKWVLALRSNVVLAEAARKKMLTAYVGDEGYSWHVQKTARGTTLVRKGGGRPDFESEARWYLDEDVVVLYTINNHIGFRVPVYKGIERIIWNK